MILIATSRHVRPGHRNLIFNWNLESPVFYTVCYIYTYIIYLYFISKFVSFSLVSQTHFFVDVFVFREIESNKVLLLKMCYVSGRHQVNRMSFQITSVACFQITSNKSCDNSCKNEFEFSLLLQVTLFQFKCENNC